MKTITNVTVQISHTSPVDFDKIEGAVIKGIYGELDIKRIAAPAQVSISAKTVNETDILPEYKRVNSDVYGNPRYVVHYLAFLGEGEHDYALAHNRAKSIGGAKYRGKDFGGGFVIQSYNIDETLRQIVAMRNSK